MMYCRRDTGTASTLLPATTTATHCRNRLLANIVTTIDDTTAVRLKKKVHKHSTLPLPHLLIKLARQ
ncbi:Hypothetical protein CINCED_3A020890 [Cinara cedri]|uniref:Uncharacterized protein n=1 Tax=Cinara cedri TaxID=506608 RepID=A0A5E4MQG3_9HEMI|nr:Hypothetical protein CINCED_3A020890 [Cinara cedri]